MPIPLSPDAYTPVTRHQRNHWHPGVGHLRCPSDPTIALLTAIIIDRTRIISKYSTSPSSYSNEVLGHTDHIQVSDIPFETDQRRSENELQFHSIYISERRLVGPVLGGCLWEDSDYEKCRQITWPILLVHSKSWPWQVTFQFLVQRGWGLFSF